MCGEVKSKEKEKTSSTPLVTVSDLQRLSYGEAIWLRLRMMPYKTKLTDHYKMSFGKKYEKAGYPIRDKKEVQLFDLKQFVKDMKKNQMQQMLGDIGDGPEINPMPFGLPGLGGMNGGANPFMSSNNEMPQTFNVDDLVKRIDAKIAELEEEEKQEKAAQEKQEKLDNKEKKNDKKLYEDDTDDDKFFDDFFNDED